MDKIVKGVKLPEEVEEAAPKEAPRSLSKSPISEVVPLRFPLEFEGVEYHELTVSRLKGKAFRQMQKLSATLDPDVALLACMTGAPPEVIDDLDAEDHLEVMKVARGFLPAGMVQEAISAGGESS